MKKPVLSQNDKKDTLAAKTGRKRKYPSVSLKNQLTSSVSTVRPQRALISPELKEVLENQLKDVFKYEKPQPINWHTLKSIPKEVRKAYRKSLLPPTETSSSRAYISFGVNAVSRLIDKKCANLVLLDSNVEPPFLLKHIMQACSLYTIPFYEVPNLRSLTQTCFGFASIAAAFKILPETDPLFQMIKSLGGVSLEPPEPESATKVAEEHLMKKTKIVEPTTSSSIVRNVYLYRKEGTKERKFIPKNSGKSTVSMPSRGGNENLDFIEFGKMDLNEFSNKKQEVERVKDNDELKASGGNKRSQFKQRLKGPRQYQDLKVKVIQPNPSRKRKNRD